MKHFIIISTLIINSVFSQLVLENSYNYEDLGLQYDDLAYGIQKPHLDRDYDANDDGVNEIIKYDYDSNGSYLRIIDVSNGTLLGSLSGWSSDEDSLITFANIFCASGCMNIIYLHTQNNFNKWMVGRLNKRPTVRFIS